MTSYYLSLPIEVVLPYSFCLLMVIGRWHDERFLGRAFMQLATQGGSLAQSFTFVFLHESFLANGVFGVSLVCLWTNHHYVLQ